MTSNLQCITPDSVLPYPDMFSDRAKFFAWKLLYPIYRLLTELGLTRHNIRQNYVIGRLSSGVSVEKFVHYLGTQGFGNHFVAWKDKDELIGLRRLEDFEWQWHIRIFDDGEIRAHYECTPESHPILHFREVGMKPWPEASTHFLRDWITFPK